MTLAAPSGEMKPLVAEVAYADPAGAAALWAGRSGTVFLDSAKPGGRLGRYSFLAVEPFRILTARDRSVQIDAQEIGGNPFEKLKELMAGQALAADPALPPFQGGAAGYFGYDLGRHLERLPATRVDDVPFPDLALGFYDLVAAWDHRERRAFLFSSGLPETEPAARRRRAEARLAAFRERIEGAAPLGDPPGPPGEKPAVRTFFPRADYEAAVQRVIDYILAGDIFQANMTQRFRTALPEPWTPFDLYRRLRALNPAPFGGYIEFGETVLASSSPERFLRLRDGLVETRPIKGTRPRGRDEAEDAALKAELEASEKDRAENVMIVDLLRNDISRVCADDSVAVPELCVTEAYATVFHLVSTVTGRLAEGRDASDLLAATFPGGSITGAPKIRAMEIIAELEPNRRGPYCGSMAWLGFDGAMDSNIVIRTYAIQGREVTFQAGGGIVADSVPAKEYEESLDKARALMHALSPEAELDAGGDR